MKRRRGRRGFWWWSWLLALITIGTTVGGYFYGKKRWEDAPKDYVAVAVVSVDIRKPFAVLGVEVAATGLLNENESRMVREIESSEGLKPIVESLGLAKKWAMSVDEATTHLRSSIDLNLDSGSKELSVVVTRHDPEESAEIANAVARAVPGRIEAADEKMVEAESAKLKAEIQPYIKDVEESRLALKAAFEANNIPIDPREGLDVGPYNQIPAVVSANLAWVEALDFHRVAVKGQSEISSYLDRGIKPSFVKEAAVPPTRISGPALEPFQLQTGLYGLTLGLLVGSLLMFIFWKLFP
ncbi:hypothetical protein V2O64_04965 [Verrucomicrobiaceae bacterium 227]